MNGHTLGRAAAAAAAFGLMLCAASLDAQAVFKICIDAGHGGADPGAVGCGAEEEDIVLDTCMRLKALLDADPDLSAIMTRTSDTSVSLGGRTSFANDNGAYRFASIHSNAFNGQVSGIETFSATNGSAASNDQRNKIQKGMTAAWPQLPDRGAKTAGFYVLVNTSMPATLSELAFTDNCAVDALILQDPAQRQVAAQVHHAALRASLGLGATTIDPPPVDPPDEPTTGDLKGVVFVDQGVGTADMSQRIPGAKLIVSGGPGESQVATASSPDANWGFTLEAGTWNLLATAPGYLTSSQSCVVGAGQTSWCSIGMVLPADDPPVDDPPDDPPPDDPPPDDPPPDDPPADDPPVDDPPADDPPTDDPPGTQADAGSSADAARPPQDTAAPADAGPVEDAGPGADVDRRGDRTRDPRPGTDRTGGGAGGDGVAPLVQPSVTVGSSDTLVREHGGTGGCAGSGPGGTLWLALATMGLLALRRRRRLALTLAALATLSVGCSRGAPHETHQAAMSPRAASARPAIQATGVTALTPAGGFINPVWSPDGAHLALTTDTLDRLLVVPATGGEPRELTRGAKAGYAPVWLDAQTLGYRTQDQRMSDIPQRSVDLEGRAAAPPQNPTPGRWVLVRDHQILVRHGRTEQQISPPTDRYCCAALSPDGTRVAFLGVESGLHVYDIPGGRLHGLGPGGSPAWSADSAQLLYVDSLDDGAEVVSRAVMLATFDGARVSVRPVDGLPADADTPCMSPDGQHLAVSARGVIYSAGLE